MSKPYFLMKAQTFREDKIDLTRSRWFWSIKLDGMRCFWDGGVTRGRVDVPWCKGYVSTGLWSINGKVIHAPDWFLNQLPKRIPLDGELWAGVGNFQLVMSVCRSLRPDPRWEKIQFKAYDVPSLTSVYSPRQINEKHCKINIDFPTMKYFHRLWFFPDRKDFSIDHVWPEQATLFENNETVSWLEQYELEGVNALIKLEHDVFPKLLEEGHEGIMFRRYKSRWTPTRSWDLLKLKPFTDDEAKIIGVQFGRDTDKGGKHLGRAGCLICNWNGKKIKVAGLTDEERRLTLRTNSSLTPEQSDSALRYRIATQYAYDHAGEEDLKETQCDSLRVGTTISFKYRELTDDGMPKDPRYYRKRDEE